MIHSSICPDKGKEARRHHHSHDTEFQQDPQIPFAAPWQSIPPSPYPNSWEALIYFQLYGFAFSRVPRKWKYVVCSFWGLTSFT